VVATISSIKVKPAQRRVANLRLRLCVIPNINNSS
jgi:hypothetical protein